MGSPGTLPFLRSRSRARRGSARRAGLILLALALPGLAHPEAFAGQEAPPPLLTRYDFARGSGSQLALPRGLREISGLAITPDGRLLAHDDERAVIGVLDPASGAVIKSFRAGIDGIRGDFEGIALAEGRILLSTSAGELLELEEGPDRASMSYRVHTTGLGRRCELEGLAYDPRERALLLPCKEAKDPSLARHLVVFAVELDSMKVSVVPRVFLPWSELDDRGIDPEFHPSAVEVDPVTGRILVLAGREEALVELTPQGRLLGAAELPRRDHPQPEGLALLPDGTLVIADEGQGGLGLLTRYRAAHSGTGGAP